MATEMTFTVRAGPRLPLVGGLRFSHGDSMLENLQDCDWLGEMIRKLSSHGGREYEITWDPWTRLEVSIRTCNLP